MSHTTPILLLLAVSLVAFGEPSGGQPPANPPAPPADLRAAALKAEQENLARYRRLTTELLALAQRFEMGDDPDARAFAGTLRVVLELADREGVEILFGKVVKLLQLETPGGADFNNLYATSNHIDKVLLEMFTRLGGDPKVVALRRDVNEVRGVIKEIEEVKKAQEVIAAKTEIAKTPPETITVDQQNLADRTKKLGAGFTRRDEKGQPVFGPNDRARQKLDEAVAAQNAAAPLLKQAKWEAAHKHQTAAIEAIDAALQDVQARAKTLIARWVRLRAVELDAAVWDLFARERTVLDLTRVVDAAAKKKQNPDDVRFERGYAPDAQKFFIEHLEGTIQAVRAEPELAALLKPLADALIEADRLVLKLRAGEFGEETQRLEVKVIDALAAVRADLQTHIAPHRVGLSAEGAPEHASRARTRLAEAELLRSLEALIRRRDAQRPAILEWERVRALKPISDVPSIKPVGTVVLEKGKTKKLQHSINWNLYPKDELTVTLAVYAATDTDRKAPLPADVLGNPPRLKLNFDDHQTQFEYELKAGDKEGEYVLVLAPVAGEPVAVPVTVK